MNNNVEEFVELLASKKTDTERCRVVENMLEMQQPTVSELLAFVNHLKSSKRLGAINTIIKAFKLIKYPENKQAIPLLVSEASKINSPNWELASDILIDIGEPAVPAIRKAFSFCLVDSDEYSLEIQGLCSLIERIDEALVEAFLPELLLALQHGSDKNCVDEYALWCVEKIEPSKLNIAIQILGDIAVSSRRETVRVSSLKLLGKFDAANLISITHILMQCLNDKSETVRNGAQKIIEKINDR